MTRAFVGNLVQCCSTRPAARHQRAHIPHNATVARDLKERVPRVWCPTCNKTQPMIFDVMKANNNEHDAADIVCGECKSIIATLHAPSVRRTGVRPKRAAKEADLKVLTKAYNTKRKIGAR